MTPPAHKEPVRVLHLDDSPDDAQLIALTLEVAHDELPTLVAYVKTKQEFLKALECKKFDIILSDWRMPGYTGDDALVDAKRFCPDIPFIMVAGEMGEDRAIETLKRGASDYVLKGNMIRLVPAIERALAESANKREASLAQEQARKAVLQIEEKIREGAERMQRLQEEFRLLVEHQTDMVARMSREGKRLYVNPNFLAMVGKTAEEVLGTDYALEIHPEDARHVSDEWKKTFEPPEYRSEITARTMTVHGWRHLSWRNTALFNEKGEPTTAISVGRDVTELVEAERALKMANEHLDQHNRELEAERAKWQNLIEGMADEVWACDLQGHVDLVNLSCTVPMGFSECQGKPLADVLEEVEVLQVDGSPRAPEEAPLLRALKGEIVRGIEIVRHKKSGQVRYRQHSAAPVRDSEGNVTGSVAVVRDVTEARQAELRLKESEERFRAMADNIPQLAWMTDETGWIFWYNQRWFDYTGTTLEEMEGWGWQKVHHPDHVGRVTDKFRQALVRGEFWEDTFPLRSRTGEFRWFLSRAFPIKDEHGKVVSWFGTNTDVTELRSAEAEIRQLNAHLEERVKLRTAELERMNKELEAFSYSVSHDLRAPLRIIDGFAALLARQTAGRLTDKEQDSLANIQEQAARMDELIKALLEFSRLMRSEVKHTAVDTRRMVEEVVAEQRYLLGEEAGRKIFVVLGELPVVKADPILLRMVFTNLISNAFKFTRPVPEPKVEIGAKKETGVYSFHIADNGVGFAKGQTEKLFRVFQRLHGPGQFEGTGIGLANVRKIIERHGGQVCGDGEEGKGAAFYFTLPYRE